MAARTAATSIPLAKDATRLPRPRSIQGTRSPSVLRRIGQKLKSVVAHIDRLTIKIVSRCDLGGFCHSAGAGPSNAR
jgi:hypothetical protein